ncbi:MAG: sialidase family protein [Vicinamibacterales bacterium]
MHRFKVFAPIAVIAALAATSTTASTQAPSAGVSLAVDGRTNQTPWVASHGSFVAAAWGASAAGKADVYLAVSRDGGQTFGQPVRVNAAAGEARVSGEIAPRVAVVPRAGSPDPEVVVLWNAKDTTTHIKVARSRDGGRTFAAALPLQSPGTPGDRGWQALAVDARGTAHALWLDHRGMAAGGAKPMDHKGEHDGVAMAQRSGLYYSTDTGGISRERELFKGVCYCCKTAFAAGRDGSLYAAWRHVFEGNFRDMGFTSSKDGGKTFSPLVRVHQDGWSINGCPDDGPAMAVDARGAVHLVWPTVSGGTEGALHYAISRDGRSFGAPVRVPTLGGPKPSHPQIAIDGAGRVVIAWDEVRNGVRNAALTRVRPGNGPVFEAARTLDAGTSAYPVMTAVPNGLLVAWTAGSPNQSVISTAVIR